MDIFFQESFKVKTTGRLAVEITDHIEKLLVESEIGQGLCNIFIRHTSASLLICENADPKVLRDLEAFLVRLVPDGDRLFSHQAEGPDDMPAHIRTILTQSSLTVPIAHGKLLLGTWQGIYLYEHRTDPYQREVIVSLFGERLA